MRNNRQKSYEEHDSPFFCLRSQKKLADLLWVSKSKMRALARDENLYFDFPKRKASGDVRIISAPRTDLKEVQKRIADLLQRIAPPDYLFCSCCRPVICRQCGRTSRFAFHTSAGHRRFLPQLHSQQGCLVFPQADAVFRRRGRNHQGNSHEETNLFRKAVHAVPYLRFSAISTCGRRLPKSWIERIAL